jgi:hypothetical protein
MVSKMGMETISTMKKRQSTRGLGRMGRKMDLENS